MCKGDAEELVCKFREECGTHSIYVIGGNQDILMGTVEVCVVARWEGWRGRKGNTRGDKVL